MEAIWFSVSSPFPPRQVTRQMPHHEGLVDQYPESLPQRREDISVGRKKQQVKTCVDSAGDGAGRGYPEDAQFIVKTGVVPAPAK